MDPLTAFSLAGTVIQFVDYGTKLILGARDLYKSTSGSLSVNEELELVISDLRDVLFKIEPPTLKIYDFSCTPVSKEQDFEESFIPVLDSARALTLELLRRLESLKVNENLRGHYRAWSSLFQAVKSAWDQDELQGMNVRLRTLKDTLDRRILYSLRQNFDLFSLRVTERFDNLDRQTQYIISALAANSSSAASRASTLEETSTLTTLLCRLEIDNNQEHRRTREMIASIGNRQIVPNIEVQTIPYDEEVKTRKLVGNKILEDLHFATMTQRFEEVAEAYQKTFNWIFDETTDEQLPWSNLSEWLQHGEGVYWVKGKAGSGKSTLMKFVYEDPRTRYLLSKWSSDTPLYTGSFFFWVSGTREQKSQQGLLRALLFEVLNQQPDLIPVVLPSLWSRTYTRVVSDKSGFVNESWSLRSLKDSFRLLVNQEIVPLKLCLFIDGLDEFDGDHEEVSELFKGITSTKVKVCLSSRPWVVFEECFRDFPCLKLQDLSRPDIELYVQQVLAGNSAFQRLAAHDPLSTMEFIQEIVEKADGVFLWVVLVARSLLHGIRNRDSMPDLQSRLRRIPRELEPLYSHLLDMIEPEYLPWASKAFQVLRRAQQLSIEGDVFTFTDQAKRVGEEKNKRDDEAGTEDSEQAWTLSILGLCLAMNEDLDLVTIQAWTPPLVSSNCDDAEFQLTARCAGLVEVWHARSPSPHSKIHFLHRTAHDYLLQPSVWDNLLSYTSPYSFNPDVSIARSYVLQLGLNQVHQGQSRSWEWDISLRAIIHAHQAEKAILQVPPEALENLERMIINREPVWMMGKAPWNRGWTQIQKLPEAKSFLPIAAMFGLTSYLRSKPVKTRNSPPENGVSLLHYAIPRDWSRRHITVPQSRTVDLLLNSGNDPNLVYDLKSPWQQALSYARGQLTRDDPWLEQAEVLKILACMLNGGANPQVNIQVDGHLYSVQRLIHDMKDQIYMSLGDDVPPEILELSKALEATLAGNSTGPSKIKYRDDMKQSKRKQLASWMKGFRS